MTPTLASFIANGALALLLLTGFFYHEHSIDKMEKEKAEAVAGQAKADVKICSESKTPTNEANLYAENNNATLLADCVARLQQPKKCTPVYVSRPAGGPKTTCEQPASGIDSSAIEAKRIEAQKDRNDLNVAKVWALGYEKFTNPNK